MHSPGLPNCGRHGVTDPYILPLGHDFGPTLFSTNTHFVVAIFIQKKSRLTVFIFPCLHHHGSPYAVKMNLVPVV